MLNISKENKDFGKMNFFAYGSNAVIFGYMSVYLNSINYSGTRIGSLMSVTIVMTMASQMLSGYMSDNIVSIKKICLSYCLITLIAAASVPFVSNSFIAVALLFSAMSLTGRNIQSLSDLYINKLARKRSGLDYGFTRGIASLGYAIAAFLTGIAIDALGINSIFAIHTVLLGISILTMMKLEDVPAQTGLTAARSEGGFIKTATATLKTEFFTLVTLATTITFLGCNMVGTFQTIIIKELGGNGTAVGMSMLFSAFSEVPVMIGYRHLVRKFGWQKLLMVSFVMIFVKIFLCYVFFSSNAIVAIQLTQGLAYGLFLPSMLLLMGELLPEKIYATGIMLFTAIYGGISGIVGNLTGGYIYESMGGRTLYLAGSACCIIGLILIAMVLVLWNKKHNTAKV